MGRGGRGTFGLTSRGGSNTRARGSYRGSWRGGRGRGRGGYSQNKGADSGSAAKRDDEGTQLAERFERVVICEEVDEKLGFTKLEEGQRKEGWLVNMHPVSISQVVIISS